MSSTTPLWIPPSARTEAPQSDLGVESLIQLYDSEVEDIGKVVSIIRSRFGADSGDLDAIDREITDRFNDINLRVETAFFHTNVTGIFIIEVTIQGRIENDQAEFDHEKMKHEVQSNVLGLDEEAGALAPGGKLLTPKKII